MSKAKKPTRRWCASTRRCSLSFPCSPAYRRRQRAGGKAGGEAGRHGGGHHRHRRPGKFAVDAWAAQHDCAISTWGLPRRYRRRYWRGTCLFVASFTCLSPCRGYVCRYNAGPLGIFIGWHVRTPFARTLRLIPHVLRVGVGCRRGISAEAVVRAVQTVFAENGLDTAAICGIYSIDLKQDEAGLLAACEKQLAGAFLHGAAAAGCGG